MNIQEGWASSEQLAYLRFYTLSLTSPYPRGIETERNSLYFHHPKILSVQLGGNSMEKEISYDEPIIIQLQLKLFPKYPHDSPNWIIGI